MPNKFGETALGIGAGAVNGAVGQAMGLVFGGLQDKRQREQAKKLAEIQAEQNRKQADYQQKLGLDMWEKTGYGATVEQMKKAGVNPGLMMGAQGGGGSTQGGSVAGVSGQSAGDPNAGVGMGVQMASQIALMNAQKENIEADTANKKAGAGKTEAEGQIVRNTIDSQISKIESDAQSAMSEAATKMNENIISNETYQNEIKRIQQEAVGAMLDNEVKKTSIDVSRSQINKLEAEIVQKWKELELKGQENDIKKFSEEIKASFPSMFNVAGGITDNVLRGVFEMLKGTKKELTHKIK